MGIINKNNLDAIFLFEVTGTIQINGNNTRSQQIDIAQLC